MKRILSTVSPHPSILPRQIFTLHLLYLLSIQWHKGMVNGDCGQIITCLCFSFLLRSRTPYTLSLLQHGVPPTGDSSP